MVVLKIIPNGRMSVGEKKKVLNLLVNEQPTSLLIECVSIEDGVITVRPYLTGKAFIATPAGKPYGIESL